MSLPLRILHGFMAAMFALSVLLQFNDPSPLPWIAMYGAAAVVTGLAAAGCRPGRFAIAVGGIALLWEIHYISLGAWHTPFGNLTQEWHMTNETIVNGREFYALLWIAAWMALVWFNAARVGPRKGSAD